MSANSAVVETEHAAQDRVGLADELHVAVLDSVVHHLDVMAGAIRSHVAAAGLAIDLRRDPGEDGRDNLPRGARPAGHERRAFERALFAAGNTAADEMDSLSFELLAAALRVGEERIAAVDDDVALLEKRHELADDRIDRRAGLDHDHRLARSLQGADELLHRRGRLNVFSLSAIGGELLRDGGRAVEDSDLEALRLHVEDEIFAHDGQADEANITLIRFHFRYLLNASPCRSDRVCRLAEADGNLAFGNPYHNQPAAITPE